MPPHAVVAPRKNATLPHTNSRQSLAISTSSGRGSTSSHTNSRGRPDFIVYAEDFNPPISGDDAFKCAQAASRCRSAAIVATPPDPFPSIVCGGLFQKVVFASSLNQSSLVRRNPTAPPMRVPKGHKLERIKYPMLKSKSARRAALAGDQKAS